LVQIFLSYARIDDELPSNVADGTGFVTSLYQELYHQFRQSGDVETKIWRDIRDLDASDQFDQVIKDAIDASALLLVVLSPNWMNRPFCRQELDHFRDRWKQLGPEKVKHRIIVACKRFVPFGNRPSLLQGQKGHEFFAFDGPDYTGTLFEYFQRGQPQDKRYYGAVGGLATSLSLRAQRVTKNQEIEPAHIDAQADDLKNKGIEPMPRPAAPNARKIYLAKPASDMQIAYRRLVEELSHNGYAIVPDPDKAIPYDASATGYIDQAAAEADVSIHLLGEENGYAPEKCEPIVRLQLARAKERLVVANAQNGENGSGGGFRRIIWAPETMEESAEAAAAEKLANPAAGRPPLDVLKQFGDFQSNDKVLGGTISKFVDFLEENLRAPVSTGHADGSIEPTEDDWVYVYHVPADTDYACDLIDAFKQHGVSASLPALEGEPAELERIHKQRLAECSAVVLCWAQATEAWAHARAHELKDLKRLGRQKKFAYRGLLAGPPPGVRKTVFVKYPPANEIDVVLNLSEDRRPLTEAIDTFIQLAPSHAP
jgi:hypothetical protein